MDRYLRYTCLSFELNRADITERRMTADGVVEALDVVKHVGLGITSGAVGFAGRAFGLQR